jgi:hypothetical protein
VTSKLVVVPSPHMLPSQSSSVDGLDIWSVRVPQAHISDSREHNLYYAIYVPLVLIHQLTVDTVVMLVSSIVIITSTLHCGHDE